MTKKRDKKRVIERLALIYAALCALMGTVLAAAMAASPNSSPFLLALTAILLLSAAFTLAWLIMSMRDKAVRTRSVMGFFSIISVVPTVWAMLFLLAGLLRHWRGGLVIGGAESQLAKPSEPAIVLEMKGDPEHGGIVEQGFQTSITGWGMEA